MSCKYFRSIDLDESEEQVDSGPGELVGIWVYNANAAVRYLKVYDNLAASVTVGTTVPDMTYPIPPSDSGFYIVIPAGGASYSTGLTVAATTGVADNDNGAPSANDVIVNLFYVP